MTSMRKRFDDLLQTLDSIAFMKMDERLERFFTDRFKSTKSKEFSGSHQDIASSLSTSREVYLPTAETDGAQRHDQNGTKPDRLFPFV